VAISGTSKKSIFIGIKNKEMGEEVPNVYD
jgi:hypothetical protein